MDDGTKGERAAARVLLVRAASTGTAASDWRRDKLCALNLVTAGAREEEAATLTSLEDEGEPPSLPATKYSVGTYSVLRTPYYMYILWLAASSFVHSLSIVRKSFLQLHWQYSRACKCFGSFLHCVDGLHPLLRGRHWVSLALSSRWPWEGMCPGPNGHCTQPIWRWHHSRDWIQSRLLDDDRFIGIEHQCELQRLLPFR